jgi:hypothetical protein
MHPFPTTNSKMIKIDDRQARLNYPSPSISNTLTTNLAIPNSNVMCAMNFNSSQETSKPVSPMNAAQQNSLLTEVL